MESTLKALRVTVVPSSVSVVPPFPQKNLAWPGLDSLWSWRKRYFQECRRGKRGELHHPSDWLPLRWEDNIAIALCFQILYFQRYRGQERFFGRARFQRYRGQMRFFSVSVSTCLDTQGRIYRARNTLIYLLD